VDQPRWEETISILAWLKSAMRSTTATPSRYAGWWQPAVLSSRYIRPIASCRIKAIRPDGDITRPN